MDYNILTGPESVQGSAEWLEWRRTRICASDAPIIMKESVFKTPLQLYQEKVNGEKSPTTPAMQRGKNLEPVALEWLNFQIGPPFFSPAVIESKLHENLGASLDAFRIDIHGNAQIAEIKCPGEADHLEALSRTVPLKYRAQLEHQMMITGAPYCWYVSFDGSDGVYFKVFADLAYQKTLLAQEQAFLALMRNKTPPKASEMDISVINDPTVCKKAERYKALTEEIESLSIERDALREELTQLPTTAKTYIGPLLVQKIEREGNIDYKRIPELNNINLNQYRKSAIITWKISVKDVY